MQDESTKTKTILDPEFLRKLERLAIAAKRVRGLVMRVTTPSRS